MDVQQTHLGAETGGHSPCLPWTHSWTARPVLLELGLATTLNPNKGTVRDMHDSSIWRMELLCTGVCALSHPPAWYNKHNHRESCGEDGRATWQSHRVDRAWGPESPQGSSNQRIPFRALYKPEINYYVWAIAHSWLFVSYCNGSTVINMPLLSEVPTTEAVCFPILVFTRAFHWAIMLLKTRQMM